MNPQLILLSVDVATIVMLVLFGVRVALVHLRRREGWIIVLLCIATICHVALSRVEYGPWMPEPYRFSFGAAAPFMNVIRNLTPGLFALQTYWAFTDRRRQPFWLYALLAAQLLLEILRVRTTAGADTLSAWLQAAFAVISIYWAIGYWRADLIEARRRTRAVVTIILGINVVLSSILLRLVIPGDVIENYYCHNVLAVMALLLMVFLVFRLMNGQIDVISHDFALEPSTVASQVAGEPNLRSPRLGIEETRKSEDELALKRLETLLHQHIHRQIGLSLKQLAERVGVPEYRMRQLIHEHLGHRNFNSFLHVYRIRDAAEQLADPVRRDVPITEIAQSVGYESINTFNRGFKEVMNLTPSEFRQRPGNNEPAQAAGVSIDSYHTPNS